MKRRVFISIFPLVFCTREMAQPNAHVSTIDPLVRSFTNGYFGPHLAIAQLSDGSFWSDMVQIEVREAACTEE